MLKRILLIIFLSCATLSAAPREKLKALYNSLDPTSLSQHLAFYQLYPDTTEGKKALSDSWRLLTKNQQISQQDPIDFSFSSSAINAIVSLVNKEPNETTADLNQNELELIEKISQNLLNRKLKGHSITQEEEMLALPPHEIDLARGLLLSQLSNENDALQKIRNYEAAIDLMALQVLSKIDFTSPPEEKIRALNSFIFEEMHFRFPPHSVYAKDIDLYTFLPSVLDSRRGVCLGVSILYMTLAQRIGLDLEMITPPGHIYVRYRSPDKIINIETTARGIDLPSEEYLGIETRSLQERNIKEVIGLAHFNQASTFWQNDEYEKAIASYEIAQKYIPDDKLLMELLAYNYLFVGKKGKGNLLLTKVKDHVPDYAIAKETMAEDYLKGAVDVEGIKAYFMRVDENRESIIKKRDALQEVLTKYPKFRNGLQGLAIAWIQLHRAGEALEALKKFHQLDPHDPSTEYYLAVLYAQRLDYNRSWEHLNQLEKILNARDHHPKALTDLRKELNSICPE